MNIHLAGLVKEGKFIGPEIRVIALDVRIAPYMTRPRRLQRQQIVTKRAFVGGAIDSIPSWQAHVTFAIARHTAVDLAQVFGVPIAAYEDRLRDGEFDRMRDQLAVVGVRLVDTQAARERLRALRRSYEPYLFGLSRRLTMAAAAVVERAAAAGQLANKPAWSRGRALVA